MIKIVWTKGPFWPLKLCLQSGLCPWFSHAAAQAFPGFQNAANKDGTGTKLMQTEFLWFSGRNTSESGKSCPNPSVPSSFGAKCYCSWEGETCPRHVVDF